MLAEEERKRKEEMERRAKLEEIAAKQLAAEIAAEEREKRDRERAIQARLEEMNKPGKFIPPSLRRKLEGGEEPRRATALDSSDSWNDRREVRPHLDERREVRPPLFGGRGSAPARETEGEIDSPPPPPGNRYQPPRARFSDSDGPPPSRSYEPPRSASRGDAYEPPRGAPRGGDAPRDAYDPPRGPRSGEPYAPPGGRPVGRPIIGGRPLGGSRPSEDRW